MHIYKDTTRFCLISAGDVRDFLSVPSADRSGVGDDEEEEEEDGDDDDDDGGGGGGGAMFLRTMTSISLFWRLNFYVQLLLLLASVVPVAGDFLESRCRPSCERISNNENNNPFCDRNCKRKQKWYQDMKSNIFTKISSLLDGKTLIIPVTDCLTGCKLYHSARTVSCSQLCSNEQTGFEHSTEIIPLPVEQQYCVIGCTKGLKLYVQTVEQKLGRLRKPEIVRSSLSHSSVTLNWTGVIIPNITLLVHIKTNETQSEWQIWNHYKLSTEPFVQFNITNLRPYTTYVFKILAVITSQKAKFSPPSVSVQTLPHGVPSSPRITDIIATSPSAITVTWKPPVFPNGDLLGYKLFLHPVKHPLLQAVTREVPCSLRSWTFSQLQSSQSYRMSVSAWNPAGEGSADSRSITTPNPGNLKDDEMPYLVLGANNMVLKLNLENVFDLPDKLHESKNKSVRVEGIGVHIHNKQILFSDSEGKVNMMFSNSSGNVTTNIYPNISFPMAITIDWLNDIAYIIGKKQIYMCYLPPSSFCKPVIKELDSDPADIKVDPINGYLYFALSGPTKGIFRIDLADIENMQKANLKEVIGNENLLSFVIDFENIRLYFPNSTYNTMMETFLDGTDTSDIRRNAIRPHFYGIVSIVCHNQLFYWTDGNKILGEIYDKDIQKYHHNQLWLTEDYFRGFNMFYPSAQPIPVPHSSPEKLEVLFSDSEAHIRWKSPKMLQYQGSGAWNRWKYQLNVTRHGHQPLLLDVSGLNCSMKNLPPKTKFDIMVRAYMKAEHGPWSEVFTGETLHKVTVPPHVIVATKGSLSYLHLDGQSQKIIIPTSRHQNIKDLAWHQELIMGTYNNETLFIYNQTSKIMTNLQNIALVHCVAFDWLGEKIYWSNRKGNLIKRSNLYGNDSEIIYYAAALDMIIDSVKGILYWNTINSIEASYLNGDKHLIYYNFSAFTTKSIISLTLNFDEHKVYWVIHGVGIKEMYMADMIGYGNANVNKSVHLAATLDTMSRSSGLQYFSSRLFWLNTDNLLLVSDMKGNNTSVMTTFDSNITSFLVVHSSLQKYPAGLDKNTLKIIPELVPLNTIHTTGHYSLFNLTWKAVEVNYGDIFYELSLQPGERKKVVTNNWYTMNGTSPYLLLIVTIRPFTYWGCGPVTSHVVRTPMSVPSEPQSPRVYISQRKEQKSSIQFLAADLRWSAPEMLNGELSQYNVYYQNSDNPGKGWTMKRCKPFDRQFILKNLGVNQTYHFQIEACTPVGCGKKSSLVSAITNNLNPVPQLLIATDSAIRLSEVDSAINTSKIIADVASTALTFLAKDNNIFWFDKQNFLLVQNKSSQIKLTKLEGKIKDVTIDWISRIIYVANSSDSSSNIVRFSIDNKQLVTIVKNAGSIVSLAVNPYSSLLFWTVADGKGYNKIIRSQSDGKGASNLLAERSSRRNRSKRDIFRNCPSADFISPAIAVDYSENEIYFVDKRMLSIWKIDENGHKCLQNFASTGGNGLPPDSMTVDHLRLYWSNSSEGKLYSIDKLDGSNLLVSSMSGVQDIVAYGPHLQPLPDQQCLTPTAAGDISLVEISNTSVTLLLPKVKKPWCKNISQPLTKYTIYYTAMPENSLYSKCGPNALQCISKESYDREMVIDGLEPYTEYLFQVALSNAYTDFLTDVLGPPLIKWTRPGAPSPVHHLNTKVFTSESIEIKWTQPVHLNGPITDLIYVVNWTTETSIGHKIQKGSTLKSSNLTVTTVINELKAGHLYTFKVKMCQSNIMLCSNVSETKAKTYLEPGSFKLKEASSTVLIISWTSPDEDSIMRHSFHYALVTESKLAWKLWFQFPLPHTKRNMVYNITLKGLQPDTWYCIRVTVVYESKKTYHWPRDSSFKFKTLSDVPNPPTPPKVREIKSGTYEISWPKPVQNGSPISQYQLQYYTVTNKRQNWTLIYSGTEPRWMVDEKLLPTAKTYYFQVRAANSIGWGEFSSNSSLFFLPKVNKNISHDNSTITLAVAICFIMVILILACFAAWAVFKRRQTNKRKAAQFVNAGHSPDVELAMLQDLPHIAVQQNNTLYSVSIVPTDADIAALPHFRHDQLMMIKFLGSGAFGEVFEGVAKNIIGDSSGDTRVAVKTLRKCASDQEKEEFLKEALLMSNFKHEHILRLLGVCLESNPQFIVLELMEGGDLLSFLRHCRPSPVTTTLLMVSDLMKICVHVARGCKYLEEMHFVHRDLAARNCLVSAKNPGDMIVKIGDFGLARDIYKNDYYRKEGEGLLPVRWMSPESLVDGVFTTQSDIWAFGVLMWEVVTLGQQPYPARTNIEVLQLVRTGGRLDRPENCPDYLYRLMTMCWSYTSDDRPSFIYLLQHLEQFYEHCPPDDMLSQSTITMDGLNTSGTEENEKMKMISQNGSEKQEDNEGSAQQKSLGDKQLSCRSRSLSNATDSSSVSGYMEPSKLETPKYLELICDSQDLPSPVQSTGGARPKTSTFNFQVSSPEKSDVKDSKQNDNSVNDSSNLQGSVVPRPKASGQRRNFQGLHYAQLASCSTNSSFDSDDGSEIYVTPQVSSSCTLLNRPRDPPIKGRELSKQSSVPITFKTDSSTDDRAWLKPTTNDDHNANRFCDSTQIYNSCASPTKLRIWADKNRNFINKDHNTVLLSDCPEYINASQPTSLNYPPTKISSPVFSNSHLTLV